MRIQSILLIMTLGAVALSGCADDGPAGNVTFDRVAVPVNGQVSFEFTEANNPYNPMDVVPPEGGPITELLCTVGDLDNDVGGPLPDCIEAETTVTVQLHEASEPSSQGYTAVLVDTEGQDVAVGALEFNETGMHYEVTAHYSMDLQGTIDHLEVRMGDVVVYTAPAAGGMVMLNEALGQTSISGTYSGSTISVDISGLPEGVGVEGWLVDIDADGVAQHETLVQVSGDGAVEYENQAGNIADLYDEFHVHIVGSKVNLGIATIVAPA